MPASVHSRRGFLGAAFAVGACGRKRATGYHGYALVALETTPALALVELLKFTSRRKLPLSGPAAALHTHLWKDRHFTYAAVPAARCVEEVDSASLQKNRKFQLAGQPVSADSVHGADRLWCLTTGSPALVPLLLKEGKTGAPVDLPAEPVSWDLSPRGDTACVSLADGRLCFADLKAGKVHDALPFDRDPGAVAWRSDGRLVLAAGRSQSILSAWDPELRRVVVELPLPLRPEHLCMNPDGGQLFITGEGRDAVVIAYPYRTEVAQTSLGGRKPGAMAASESPPYLFVSNPEAGTVTVFDISRQKVVAVTGVGISPGAIAVTPDQQYALVAHRGSGDLAVIRIAAIGGRRSKSAPLFTMIPVGERPSAISILPT